MSTERDKEREAELESAMYTNCLLLGLDPAVLGPSGSRSGHFRHSNPRMGEHLLYFLLSSLRGPAQSSKDFDKVWPIFDSVQSRDFRKIVQGIISELESQGALPRSNSRVSSLATCCGPRFVELLWQLSVHALREVHRRTFTADAALNPLPASLTDVSYTHAASLLPVSKARIALERRKFLKNASIAVHRQSTWSDLAHEMTAEFRALCAEEAYLQQELEKLQDLRNKAKLEGELWDDRVSNSSGQSSHLVSKATRLWESLLAKKGQHEILASGPIEDLIAHREHRYRISGASLRAAMDQSSQLRSSDAISIGIDSQADDRAGRVHPTVDVAEVLRRWTHALQRIHKQSLHLAKANDGDGPEIFQCASDAGPSGHADSLSTTLAEHRQHLVSIQGLINQLKEAIPAMQKSVSDLTDEVGSVSSLVSLCEYSGRPTSPITVQHGGMSHELGPHNVSDLTSKLSSIQLDKASTSPTLKLPHLFSSTPSSAGRGAPTPLRGTAASQISQAGSLSERKTSDHQSLPNRHIDYSEQGENYHIQNIKRSVREAAMSRQPEGESLQKKNSYDGPQQFFMPLSTSGVPHVETELLPNRRKQRLFFSLPSHSDNECSSEEKSNGFAEPTLDEFQSFLNDSHGFDYENCLDDLDGSEQRIFPDIEEDSGQVFSPPFLLETDAYEDLLAPLSETDAALMER